MQEVADVPPRRVFIHLEFSDEFREHSVLVRAVLELVSWLVASARTTTANVWVPALPPIPDTIGISTASKAKRLISP